MPLVVAYHRPDSLDEALSLVAEPNRIVLAGGTVVNADRSHSDLEVVDLQALGLGDISGAGRDRVTIGATATLAEVADHGAVPPLLRRLAAAEAPSTLRTLATVGGAVAVADAESVLLAGLLVHDATVALAGPGTGSSRVDLADLLAEGVPAGAIVTSVEVGAGPTDDDLTAVAVTGRTPADVPIVAAVARRTPAGIRLALTGVADHPRLVDPDDPTGDLTPLGDFRGSGEYRVHLASVLATRVLQELAS